jgi:hypothetical protein
MKRWIKFSSMVATLVLSVSSSACLSPTDVRPAWPFGGGDERPDNWQEQGRYRDGQTPAAQASAPASAQVVPTQALDPAQSPPAAEAPLLSWDGGVVDGPTAGAVTQHQDQKRGLEPTLEGRMHIIELYQQVLDERDSLLGEVEALTAALERAQTLLQTTQQSAFDLEARIAALEEGHRLLLSENQEIAGRLTTAQIRRLEAEKLLLESRIAWHRERVQVSDAGGQF